MAPVPICLATKIFLTFCVLSASCLRIHKCGSAFKRCVNGNDLSNTSADSSIAIGAADRIPGIDCRGGAQPGHSGADYGAGRGESGPQPGVAQAVRLSAAHPYCVAQTQGPAAAGRDCGLRCGSDSRWHREKAQSADRSLLAKG